MFDSFIAILLGRLRFTIDQALETVIFLARATLSHTDVHKASNTEHLRIALEDILVEHGYEKDLPMHDESKPEGQCKVFVYYSPAISNLTSPQGLCVSVLPSLCEHASASARMTRRWIDPSSAPSSMLHLQLLVH